MLACSGGDHQTQQSSSWDWSGERQLWWTDPQEGDLLELAFESSEAGVYDLRAVFTKAADYGIMQLTVNGEKLGSPMDFYHDGVVATKEAPIGKVSLLKGRNVLGVRVVGANPLSEPVRHMFGLDYLLLASAE